MAAATLLVSVLVTPFPVAGQLVFVIVKDSSRNLPLEGALVSLLDGNADLITAARAPAKGRLRLKAPEPGQYAVLVEHTGYRRLVSDWIALANTDTVEVTVRLSLLSMSLAPVLIEAQRDSITPLLPPGINPKAIAGQVIVPAEIERHAMGARDYVDIIGSTGVTGLAMTFWLDSKTKQQRRCIAATRSISRRVCVLVLVNNMRMTPEEAMDIATPENLDFAIWLRPVDAGVLYGTGAANGVLLLFTKDWRRVRSPPWN